MTPIRPRPMRATDSGAMLSCGAMLSRAFLSSGVSRAMLSSGVSRGVVVVSRGVVVVGVE